MFLFYDTFYKVFGVLFKPVPLSKSILHFRYSVVFLLVSASLLHSFTQSVGGRLLPLNFPLRHCHVLFITIKSTSIFGANYFMELIINVENVEL